MLTLSWSRTSINFWGLWTVNAVGNLADGIFKLALPLCAASLTTSPFLVATTSFALSLPWLVFGLPVGALVDRWDRKRIMIVVCLMRVVVLALLTTATFMGFLSLPLIYIAALMLGVSETFADTAAVALLPIIVPKEQLEKANVNLVGTQTLSNEFIGPPLGGALASVGLALALGWSGALYLIALLALFLIRGSFRPVRAMQSRLSEDIVQGLRFLWSHQLLRALVGLVTVMNLCWSAWLAILVLYVVAPGPVGLSTFGYGVLLTAIGIGGLIGTLIAIPFQRYFGTRWSIGADIIGTCVMLGVPAFTYNPWLIGLAAFIGGAGSTMWNVTVRALMQRIVPDHLMGRTSGAMRVLAYGSASLGAILAGVTAQTVGMYAVFIGGAVLNLVLLIPFFQYITPKNLAIAEEAVAAS